MRPYPRPTPLSLLLLMLAAIPAAAMCAQPAPELRREGPLPAQATGVAHTLRIIPETCHFLRGRFTAAAAAPYVVEAVARGGACQARARLRRSDAAPAGAGWVLNDVLQVPHASCPGLKATVTIWRRSGANVPPASDAQGRARLYLQDEKQRARSGALAQLGEYVYVVTGEGAACGR